MSLVLLRVCSGPFLHWSETSQLVINTGTTLMTFLMVFLIQNAQSRDSRVVHLKLNELIRGVRGARNELVDMQELSEDELEKLKAEFKALHEHFAQKLIESPRKNLRAES